MTGAPGRRGFGSRVIEATVANQLGGTVERRWEQDGLICVLTVPAARALAPGGVTARASRPGSSALMTGNGP